MHVVADEVYTICSNSMYLLSNLRTKYQDISCNDLKKHTFKLRSRHTSTCV